MHLLLLSNSSCHGHGYLDHAEDAIRAHFAAITGPVAFVPFALFDRDDYGRRVAARLADIGIDAVTVTADTDGLETLRLAGGIFVGGGNTFRLLRELRRQGMIEVIRDRVAAGVPYMGSSAGSGIAAPTLKTSNDMPILDPEGFDALALVPYQLNLHYLDADPDSRHMGETREQRLTEYLEENQVPVVALREGAWITVDGDRHTVGGETGGLILRRDTDPQPIQAGDQIKLDL